MNTTHTPRKIVTKYDLEMEKSKWFVSRWVIITALAVMVVLASVVIVPLGKVALNSTLNRPEAWFRYEGGDMPPRILVKAKIGDTMYLADELTKEQRAFVLKNYQFKDWVGPNETVKK